MINPTRGDILVANSASGKIPKGYIFEVFSINAGAQLIFSNDFLKVDQGNIPYEHVREPTSFEVECRKSGYSILENFKRIIEREAMKRFPSGSSYRSVISGELCTNVKYETPFWFSEGKLALSPENGIVYYNGKWATPVTPKEAGPKPIKGNWYIVSTGTSTPHLALITDIHSNGHVSSTKNRPKYIHHSWFHAGTFDTVHRLANMQDMVEYRATETERKEELIREITVKCRNSPKLKCLVNTGSEGTIDPVDRTYFGASPYFDFCWGDAVWLATRESKGNERICVYLNGVWAQECKTDEFNSFAEKKLMGWADEFPYQYQTDRGFSIQLLSPKEPISETMIISPKPVGKGFSQKEYDENPMNIRAYVRNTKITRTSHIHNFINF